jgi:hypothetical protein
MINTSTLRPGLLVSLKTTVSGNVSYTRQTIESEHITSEGEAKSAWETQRTVTDPKEHENAIKVRGKARSLISAVCATSAFGLLCPETAEPELEAAIAEARRLAEAFNEEATLSRISVYVITGRIAQDDVEAVRAINSEVRDLLADMSKGIENLDVKRVREAASKAKGLGSMLSGEAEARVQIAIDTARSAARQIVKAGETASQEIDTRAIRKITEARTAFLDLSDADEIAAPTVEARGIDLEPETVENPPADPQALADYADGGDYRPTVSEPDAAAPIKAAPQFDMDWN